MEVLSTTLDNLNINDNNFSTSNNNNETLNNSLQNLNISGSDNNMVIDNDLIITHNYDYGIRNLHCKTLDDENFLYNKFYLPNLLYEELTNSGFETYYDYFEAFCVNIDTCFINEEIMMKIAVLFDDIFSKKMINFETVGEFVIEVNAELNELMNENSWIQDYFSDYIQDLIYGCNIIIDAIQHYVTNFEIENQNTILRLINNLCVIIIYLKFYFESNVFTQQNLLDNDNKINIV